jgi:signal transduction histidine kinase
MSVADGVHRPGGSWGLRKLGTVGSLTLTALALFASVTLIVLTTSLTRVLRDVQAAYDETRTAEAIRVRLLAYARESGPAYFTHDWSQERARVETEAEIFRRLDRARNKATTPAAASLVDEADRKTREYIAAQNQAELGDGPPQELVSATTPLLDAALDPMLQLVRIDSEVLSQAQENATRWDRIGSATGVVVGVFVLCGFVAVAVAMRRLVFAPLLALCDGIDRFATGDRRARVPLLGGAEVMHTAESFNEMAERLERRHSDLLTFLAGVSHDLRNPLAALRMSVKYLEPGRPLPSEEKVRGTMALVDRQVARLERMVGDFLDASRIEAGQLQLLKKPSDVRDFARDVVQLYDASSFSHRLELAVPSSPVVVDCDGQRIAQVLNNLVSNAIKYSPNGGVVAVSVERKNGEAVISVSDQGIGIARSEFEQVFEPFRRTGASRETVPGVGMGLSVSRDIVKAHGGRIALQSEVGVGSTFQVRLPLAASRPEGRGEDPQEPARQE